MRGKCGNNTGMFPVLTANTMPPVKGQMAAASVSSIKINEFCRICPS
jgi:hypothetical protein